MNFIPDTSEQEVRNVPYYEDVSAAEGWQGHRTTRSIESLKDDIVICMQRLGGKVRNFQRGSFQIGDLKRDGYRISYSIETPNGDLVNGRLDIAALPVRDEYRLRRSEKTRREASLKMCLYMVRQALDGTWFLQQLSPGYAPLMPWMLADGEHTLTELWADRVMSNLLPPPSSDFDDDVVDGEFK